VDIKREINSDNDTNIIGTLKPTKSGPSYIPKDIVGREG